MTRMLGRYQAPGCCPGTRQGWRRTRRLHGLDCSGATSSTRRRKRAEQRQVARDLLPHGEIEVATDVWRDCRHGCDGSEPASYVYGPSKNGASAPSRK